MHCSKCGEWVAFDAKACPTCDERLHGGIDTRNDDEPLRLTPNYDVPRYLPRDWQEIFYDHEPDERREEIEDD